MYRPHFGKLLVDRMNILVGELFLDGLAVMAAELVPWVLFFDKIVLNAVDIDHCFQHVDDAHVVVEHRFVVAGCSCMRLREVHTEGTPFRLNAIVHA